MELEASTEYGSGIGDILRVLWGCEDLLLRGDSANVLKDIQQLPGEDY